MVLFQNKYRVESTRLKNWDYSSNGAYFVTICTKNREHFFGEIENGKLIENTQSKICLDCWLDLPNHYSNCELDEFIIMPNHVHGIVFIDNGATVVNTGFAANNVETGLTTGVETGFVINVETGFKPVSTETDAGTTKNHSLSEIIRAFKTFSARKINEFQKTQGTPFWQPRFYDRIVRDENELNRIREYIVNNPIKWEFDRNNYENLLM